MSNRLKAFWVGVCDDMVVDREVSLDVDDLGRASLSEQCGKSNILHRLSIYQVDNELQELRVWLTVDLDAMKRPRCGDDTLAIRGDRALSARDTTVQRLGKYLTIDSHISKTTHLL
jgi:hypothetical protein